MNVQFEGGKTLKIENSPQVRQGYRKPADTGPAKTFQQVMQTAAQDSYVPGVRTQQSQTEREFTNAELFYLKEQGYRDATISNATHAKLKQLAEINWQADYTGMSSDEIYADIWNRYNEAFDGNMVAITACIAGPAEWDVVNYQFVTEIRDRIVRPEQAKVIQDAGGLRGLTDEERFDLEASSLEKTGQIVSNASLKALGYDGMSFEEREAAIKEKYSGKNTTLDFLKMQGELMRSGVLEHVMGDEARTYCDMIRLQFDYAYNPNSIARVGYENSQLMTADQWYRVANQPFDAERFSTSMKEHLGRITKANGYTPDTVKIMEGWFDRFINGAIEGGMDQLINGSKNK